MDGCVTETKGKPVYYIIFTTLDIAADVYYVYALGR